MFQHIEFEVNDGAFIPARKSTICLSRNINISFTYASLPTELERITLVATGKACRSFFRFTDTVFLFGLLAFSGCESQMPHVGSSQLATTRHSCAFVAGTLCCLQQPTEQFRASLWFRADVKQRLALHKGQGRIELYRRLVERPWTERRPSVAFGGARRDKRRPWFSRIRCRTYVQLA